MTAQKRREQDMTLASYEENIVKKGNAEDNTITSILAFGCKQQRIYAF